jgi:hypothetical protein
MKGTSASREVTVIRDSTATEQSIYSFLRKVGNALIGENEIINEIILATANSAAATEDHYVKATPAAALTNLFKWLPSEVYVTVLFVPRTTSWLLD